MEGAEMTTTAAADARCAAGALKNDTYSASWSAGFIGPMSAVLLLDIMVVVGKDCKPDPLQDTTETGPAMMTSVRNEGFGDVQHFRPDSAHTAEM